MAAGTRTPRGRGGAIGLIPAVLLALLQLAPQPAAAGRAPERDPSSATLDSLRASFAVHPSVRRPGARERGSVEAATPDPALAPSAAPPWNPPAPVPSSERWEGWVRAPVLVAVSPFLLAGAGVRAGLGAAEHGDWIGAVGTRLLALRAAGFEVGPAALGDRTGTGGELRWRPRFAPGLVGALSASTGGYNRERVAFERPAFALEYLSEWRSEDLFYGVGPGAREADASNYAFFGQAARLELRVPFRTPVRPDSEVVGDAADDPFTHLPPRPALQAWIGPREAVMLDGREHSRDHPPLLERFPGTAAGEVGSRIERLAWGGRAELDARQGRPHWWRGGRAGVTVERFETAPAALRFRPGERLAPFTRWTWDGDWGASFWRDPRTLRLHLRVVDRVGALPPGAFLISDLATLGGSAGLAGFEPGRFHDADLVHGSARYIYPLGRFVESDLHLETGNVFPHLESARLDALRVSGGLALRARTPYRVFASAGLDWSRETWRFSFLLGGVE